MFKLIILTALALTACGVHEDSTTSSTVPGSDLYRQTLDDQESYVSLSKDSSGLVQNGRSLKFLIDRRNPDQPSIYFINGNFTGQCRRPSLECSRYHYDFAVETLHIQLGLNTFNKETYFTREKTFVAGSLNSYTSDTQSFYGIQLYPQDVAHEQDILSLVRTVSSAVKIPDAQLAFVATGDQQTTATIQNELAQAKILSLSLNSILGDIKYIPLHQGEAWGYLRLFPKNQDDLMPTDIPVFDELPLDLSVVAGTITRAYQDTNSHINLKSKERNTPNMVLRDAGPDHAELALWIDKPIHLRVTAQGWSISASTDAMVQEKYQERIKKPWQKLIWTPFKQPVSFANICPNQPANCLKASARFGSKGANLGFLKEIFRDRSLPQSAPLTYDPVPLGYAVPLKFYKNFINLAANKDLKTRLNAFIKKEKSGLISSAERNAEAAEIRQLILNATLPSQNLIQIVDQAKLLAPEIDKWKIRSSANAEDIDGFDGAGLHDSYAAKLSSKDNDEHTCTLVPDDDPGEVSKMKVKPKTFACAIKGVYASLWNKRAIEERSFARIDHTSIAMGLAILPSYDTESPVIANSVVVTRVINSSEVFGYTLSIQKDNNTVTNPIPGSWSEQAIAALGSRNEPPSLTTLRFAKPTPEEPVRTTSVLPRETTMQMALIAKKVEEAYCKARDTYYPGDEDECAFVSLDSSKPKSLDMEMKFLQNGEFVLKQVREFSGR